MSEINTRLNFHYQRAIDLADNFPDLAFTECRRILEIILKDYYFEETGIHPKENTSEKLMETISKAGYKPPRVVSACIRLVQGFGNFASHDQGGAELEVDRQFIEPCLSSTKALIYWCRGDIFSKVKTSKSEEKSAPGNKTLRERIRIHVEKEYAIDEAFKISDFRKDFISQNPKNSPNAIWAHVGLMTTNVQARLSHKPKKDGSDDLLFRIDKGIYRRYNPSIDPKPLMPQKDTDEWASKMLILNSARNYDDVRNSRCYLSPDKGGNYRYNRAAYVGLYKEKSVRGIGDIIARVTVESKNLEPQISWINDEELPEDTLKEWVLEQIEQRWDGGYPIQALLIGEIHDASFVKNSKGGMFNNNRIVDISEISYTTVEDLSNSLSLMKWSDFE
ncbi:MAG: Uncharacterised protein [Methanobacteriota archaeon]|nr:MAG: Uncharacterised protein [Euryarchaeota archaeon]